MLLAGVFSGNFLKPAPGNPLELIFIFILAGISAELFAFVHL
jgi:hypothetical protein